MAKEFPPREPGRLYLTEGGMETEIMYKWGHSLPHFAMFPLLDDPAAVEDMKGIWRRYMSVAKAHGMIPLTQGTDYRASPDYARLLGMSLDQLTDAIHRNIGFLRDRLNEAEIEEGYVSGVIGPRGDAYGTGAEIDEDEAEAYHGFQLDALREAGADLAWAMTFNNVPEAIGVARAASSAGLPLAMSLNLNRDGELRSGVPLKDALEQIDEAAGHLIAFYSVNCSHPEEFEPALVAGDWQQKIRCIRPNASKMDKLALCKLGHLEDGDPEELGRQMADVARRMPWMDIFGGCCGTDERHLDRIATEVARIRDTVTA